MAWSTDEFGPHVTTIYGARYNDEGWIDAIYYTDNNHGNQQTVTFETPGILEAPIIYFDLTVQQPQPDLETNQNYQTNPVAWIKDKKEGYAITIRYLQSYDLRRDLWEQYFASKQKS